MDSGTVVITISRQYGSGGSYLGKVVAKRLGFSYFDREILRRATESLGMDEADLAGREERLSNFLENFSRIFLHGSPEAPYLQPPIRPVYDSDLYRTESAIIGDLAKKYNSVVVGRCGFHVLRGHRGLINVFVHAPEEFRMRRIMQAYAITDENEALSVIREMDERRERFVRAMTGVEWTDARNFHLGFDSAFLGFETAEKMVLSLVERVGKKLQ